MPTRQYWDAVWEQTVTISWDIEEVHASPNTVKSVEYLGYWHDEQLDWVNFSFALHTTWNDEPFLLWIFFDREIMMTKHIPMIATRINRKIVEETTRALTEIWIQTLKDHKIVREEMHKHITEYDIKLLNPPEPKPKEVDLRPYVFLRFLIALPIIPEEVLHAMYVQHRAMEAQKLILKESEEVKRLQDEHYKKYWTLLEKSKTYLTNLFK